MRYKRNDILGQIPLNKGWSNPRGKDGRFMKEIKVKSAKAAEDLIMGLHAMRSWQDTSLNGRSRTIDVYFKESLELLRTLEEKMDTLLNK